MVFFLYNPYILVWIQHFSGPPLNCLCWKPSFHKPCYKEVTVYLYILISEVSLCKMQRIYSATFDNLLYFQIL